MTKASQILDLIETSVMDYLKGVGLEGKTCYWIDNLEGQECKVALIIYSKDDQGGKEYSLQDIFTQPLLNSLSKYIKPHTVKQIQSGEIKFQPVSDQNIEADRILVVDSGGVIRFWGDFVK